MSLLRHTNATQNNNWGYPLYLCDCCPYGYHIDLDFVQYCESISREADHTDTIKRRRDRRRQRKSIEVLLGLNACTDQFNLKLPEPKSPIYEGENHILRKRDTFDNVIDDFENTYQQSKNKLSNNLPDVTAVSNGGTTKMSSATTSDLPSRNLFSRQHQNAIEHCISNPVALKNVMEKLSLSLERTKILEEQIKLVPALKVKISTLEGENERLLRKMELRDETSKSQNGCQCSSKSQIDCALVKRTDGFSTKDVGITCSVLTRNVGVGHQSLNRRTVGTETREDWRFADKWLDEKLKFIEYQHGNITSQAEKDVKMTGENKINKIHSNIQDQITQTVEVLPPKKIFRSKQTQTLNQSVTQKTQSILVKPSVCNISIQKSVQTCTVGVSDDSLSDIYCEKCNECSTSNEEPRVPDISLASLTFCRNKPVNLDNQEVDGTSKSKSIAIQYKYEPECFSKSSQYESSSVPKYSQCSIKTESKHIQCELGVEKEIIEKTSSSAIDQLTVLSKKYIEKEKKEAAISTRSVGTFTTPELNVCLKCQSNEAQKEDHISKRDTTKKEEIKRKDEQPVSLSRIPRLSTTPTMERRVFKRQDTYTKISSEHPSEKNDTRLPEAKSSAGPSTTKRSFLDEVEPTIQTLEGSSALRHENISIPADKSSPTTNLTFINAETPKQRKKSVPSREMLGAMKVLNDSLQKLTKLPTNSKAIAIIQQEWFRVSGQVTADPLEVEDYLDAFEDVTSLLLEYIVNMTDTSGNTAMHYAVSHGNFDVVSILLDSKVCDINKPNKAGYTSLMLVSLAEINSQTHANVVRRLFNMADVNIRAKQHGQTALMLAVSHGRLDMVKMLLEAGADINIQDDDGSTALMCAAEHGHIEIVKLFLNHPECDSTITDVDGSSALKIAMEAGHRPIGVLLYAHERNLVAAHGLKFKKSPCLKRSQN